MLNFLTGKPRGFRVFASFLISGASLVALASPSFAQTITPPEQADETSDETIVTAQRRETIVLDTAETLTALSGKTLEALGGDGFADITALTPSLSYSENFGISQIFIRGVGNSFFSPGSDPGVALYADGVYLSDQEATGVAFLDVQRVEVLRGPQGSLYGRNATGGAVNVISQKPSSAAESSVKLTAGDFGRREAEGIFSGQFAPGARARLAVQYRALDGYADNQFPGGPDPLDGEESIAARLTTIFDVGGGELSLVANGLSQDDVGPGLKILADPFPQPAELLFGVRPSASERDFISQIADNARDVSTLTAQWTREFSDVDLTVIADARQSDRKITYDQDGTARTQSVTTLDTDSTQTSLEAYLTSKGDGRLQWLAGASGVAFDQSRTTTVSGFLPGALLDPTLPLTLPAPFRFEGGGDLESRAWAVYGEGTLTLTETFNARIGLRYNSDEKSADEFLNFFGLVSGSQEDSWDQWSGRASIEYRPSKSALVYATASHGFKAGALNVGAFTPAVDPETIVNYEIGYKYNAPSGLFDVSTAGFTSDYSDLQVVQIGPLSQILANAAQAKINGVELESNWRPAKGLRIGLNASWLDATFEEFSATDLRRGFARFNLSGNRLPLTSEWQANALVAYDWSAPRGGTYSVTGSYGWRSEYFFTEFNTPDAAQDSVGRFDLGLSWTDADDRIALSAFGRNLTDETVIGSMAIVSPLLGSVRVVSLEPPRHFGVRLGYRFQ